LKLALDVLKQHVLFAKASKCNIGETQVEYLRHIITIHGVSTDAKKASAMKKWPTTKNHKTVQRIFGIDWLLQKICFQSANL